MPLAVSFLIRVFIYFYFFYPCLYNFLSPSNLSTVLRFSFRREPLERRAKINVLLAALIRALPLHPVVRSLHRIVSPARLFAKCSEGGETEWSKQNDSIANPEIPALVLSIFFFFFFFFLFRVVQIPTVRCITAINYEGGRPKGVAKKRKGKRREKRNRRREQFALHTISTWPAVSLRENKVSLCSEMLGRKGGCVPY